MESIPKTVGDPCSKFYPKGICMREQAREGTQRAPRCAKIPLKVESTPQKFSTLGFQIRDSSCGCWVDGLLFGHLGP